MFTDQQTLTPAFKLDEVGSVIRCDHFRLHEAETGEKISNRAGDCDSSEKHQSAVL